MEELEKKIEEAACKFAKEGHLNSAMSFALGAQSPEAKEYWQQGMYSEEDLLNFSIWCGINYVRYVEKDGEQIWFDPINIKYCTTKTLLKIWLKKK